MQRKKAEKVICPRCGKIGYRYIKKIKGISYWYVSHTENGHRVEHYIGPVNGYSLVERIQNLDLKNLKDQNYLETALRALENYIEKTKYEGIEDKSRVQKLLDLIKQKITFIEKNILS